MTNINENLENNLDNNLNEIVEGSGELSESSAPEAVGADLRNLENRLNGPATPAAQNEIFDRAFGSKGAWNNNFQRLNDLRNEPARIMAWHEYKECPRKKFIEAFGDLTDLSVPRKDTAGARLPQPAIDSALSVPVDSSRLTDALCKKLDLCDFSQDFRKPAQREQRKNLVSSTLNLKIVVDSSEPLDPKHSRILVVKQTSATISALYPEGTKIPDPALVGKLLVFSEKVGAVKKERSYKLSAHVTPMTMSIYDDIHSLQRRNVFISEQYKKEMRELSEMYGALKRLFQDAAVILSAPKYEEMQDERVLRKEEQQKFREYAAAEITKYLPLLEGAVDRHKYAAGSYLEKARSFRDSLNRQNDPISIKRLIHALEATQARLEEIKDKSKYINRDADSVAQIAEMFKADFRSLRKSLDNVAVGYASSAQASSWLLFKKEKGLNQKVLQNQADWFVKACRIEPPNPESVRVAPYRQFAEAMHGYYADVKQSALERDLKGVQTAMVKMYIVSKYAAANEVMQALNMKLGLEPAEAQSEVDSINPDKILDPRSLRRPELKEIVEILGKLEKVFSEKRIFPNIRMPEFDAPFKEMSLRIKELKRQVKDWTKYETFLHPSENSADLAKEKEGLIQSLRDELKSWSVVEELAKLPAPISNKKLH
jgi:hypothetical protein